MRPLFHQGGGKPPHSEGGGMAAALQIYHAIRCRRAVMCPT